MVEEIQTIAAAILWNFSLLHTDDENTENKHVNHVVYAKRLYTFFKEVEGKGLISSGCICWIAVCSAVATLLARGSDFVALAQSCGVFEHYNCGIFENFDPDFN